MTITLRPDQEEAIRQAIDAGAISSVDEWLDAALSQLPHSVATPASEKTIDELFEPMRGMFAEGELDLSRNRSFGRPLDLE